MTAASIALPGLGVRLKLMSAFVLVGLFTGLLGWYAVAAIEKVNTGQSMTYRDVFGGTHLLATWIDKAGETRRALMAYTSSESADERAALRAQMAAGNLELEQLTQRIDAVDSDRAEVDALARVVESWRAYVQWRDGALAAADAAHDHRLVQVAYRAEGARLESAIDAAVDIFLDNKSEAGGQLEDSAQATYVQTRQLAIALSVAAVAVALGIGLFMSRHIAGAARQVAAAAEGLARGELDQRIQVRSNDELGQMAASFRGMIAYQQVMARVANAIARGDLSQNVQPKSEADVLGNAFRRMSDNLRVLVGELQQALDYAGKLIVEKDGYAATVRDQVVKLSRLLDENASLHDRLRRAALRTATLNEQGLRRIGADLHDGPCQALAFALLRLDTDAPAPIDCDNVRKAVTEALQELRSIATGLRLPELNDLALPQVVQRAVRDHERRSGTPVRVELRDLSIDATLSIKVALFRALQEALSNATRHGSGVEVSVDAWTADEWLWLTVADGGPGFPTTSAEPTGGLGLASMRERAELLGGQFQVASTPGQGTRVHLCWPLSLLTAAHVDVADFDAESQTSVNDGLSIEPASAARSDLAHAIPARPRAA